MDQGKKIGAVVCDIVYILSCLFLPFLGFLTYTVSGTTLMSLSGWCYLPLVAGVAMIVSVFLFQGKGPISAVIHLVGAFIPLIAFFLVRSDLVNMGMSGVNQLAGGSILGSFGSSLVSSALHVGFGVILAMLCGFGGAVLCFLSESTKRETDHGVGVSREDDEW